MILVSRLPLTSYFDLQFNELMTENTSPLPTPVTSTAPIASSSAKNKDCCKDGNCDNCLKGGLPVKKEITSFLFILFVGIATVLFVLLVNEKRKVLQMSNVSDDQAMTQEIEKSETEKITYEMPAEKKFVKEFELPKPKLAGKMSVEEALQNRRSRRTYADEPLTLEELSQVLWSGQGITDESGHRTAPSARSAYPYAMYVVVRNVTGLAPGLYAYLPEKNALGDLDLTDAGGALIDAGVQDNSQKAPAVIALSGSYAKMAKLFPDDPVTNTLIEAGHIGQNIYLQIEALGLSTVVTGGFDSAKVGSSLKLDPNEEIVYLIPFGNRDDSVVEETH